MDEGKNNFEPLNSSVVQCLETKELPQELDASHGSRIVHFLNVDSEEEAQRTARGVANRQARRSLRKTVSVAMLCSKQPDFFAEELILVTMWLMTPKKRKGKFARTINWLTNTANYQVMLNLRANDRWFKFVLDKLLNEVVHEQGNKIWVGEWFETVLDAFGSCVGRPSKLDIRLNALKAKRGKVLTKEEKYWISILGNKLENAGLLSHADPSQSYSSDIPEATSSLNAADVEP